MAWVRLDDKMPLNPKLRAAGLAAYGLDVVAICWSAHQEMDGFISEEDLEMFGQMYGCRTWKAHAEKLVEVGRWKRDGRRKGYVIQGFLEFNRSHTDLSTEDAVDAVVEAARELVDYEGQEHWCGSCEEFQERGKGEPCPLGQRILNAEDALATYDALKESEG